MKRDRIIARTSLPARYGAITLRGIVRQESEKRSADRLMSDFPGVAKVKNKLEVLE
jgi:osmotically-inducible protein OsmY